MEETDIMGALFELHQAGVTGINVYYEGSGDSGSIESSVYTKDKLSDNIDNLDQTNGEIIPFPYTTSNQDGYNDKFEVENLELYPNNTVTIFDLDDNTVYSASDYSSLLYSEKFPNLDDITNGIIPIGTYKYKIVIENEQTFTEYGYFCVFESDTSFVSGLIECGNGEFDPVVTN